MPKRGRRPRGQSEPPRLTIELVPGTAWFSNLRSILPKDDWDRLRRAVYRAASFRCEVCGGRGEQYPVAAHEVWEYDDKRHVQRLAGLVALCPACHEVKHMGLAGLQGRGEEAMAHLMEVNGWSRERAEAYVDRAFALWELRTKHEWEIMVDWDALAYRYGVRLSRRGTERHRGSPRPFRSLERE